jgi:alpha-1,3-rhamnosyl/mannosyltransferase
MGIVSKLIEGRSGLEWTFFSNRPDLPFQLPADTVTELPHLIDFPGNRFHLWEQVVLPTQALYYKADVLHCPHNSLPWWQPIPVVLTLHDTIEWDADEAAPGLYRDRVLPLAISRCAAVITPSKHSRDQILRHWPSLEKRLFVVPHGIEPYFLQITPGPLDEFLSVRGVREPYLLYCGGLTPRKRLNWAFEVFSTMGDQDLQLVICGVPVEKHVECQASLANTVRARVHFLPYVPAQAMARLYQNAAAVLYPTLYEGFGFPVIEAQAVGTPILFSPHSSLTELAGPSACLLQADDASGWIDNLRRFVAEYRCGRPPCLAARRWAQRFSWDQSAQAHLAIYTAAAEQGFSRNRRSGA